MDGDDRLQAGGLVLSDDHTLVAVETHPRVGAGGICHEVTVGQDMARIFFVVQEEKRVSVFIGKKFCLPLRAYGGKVRIGANCSACNPRQRWERRCRDVIQTLINSSPLRKWQHSFESIQRPSRVGPRPGN